MRDSLSVAVYRFIEYTMTNIEIITKLLYLTCLSNQITGISWRHLLATCIKIFLGNMLFIMLCRTA